VLSTNLRPSSDFKMFCPLAEGNLKTSFTAQDKKSEGLVIVFPLNLHDDSAVDQCEKLMKLKHKNVMIHTGYFRDEDNHLNMTAALPLFSDLDARLQD
jgi:hypothetical protein